MRLRLGASCGHQVRMKSGRSARLVLAWMWCLVPSSSPSRADDVNLLLRIQGPSYGSEFGKVMAGVGDVNGDGLADFLVGNIPDTTVPGHRCCWLYLGSPSPVGLPTSVIRQPEESPSPEALLHFGQVVDGGADVNGDGFDDMVITHSGWFMDTGKVYLYYGGDPLDLEPDVGIAAWGSSWMTVLWATGIRGRVVVDVNGDAFDELVCLVQPYAYDGGAHVYFGGSPMDSIHDVSLQGVSYDTLELGSDIARGDFNGDGYGALVVGVAGNFNWPAWRDAAWVFHGGPDMDEEVDVRLSPLALVANHEVCVPGDLNGDGLDDIVATLGWPWPVGKEAEGSDGPWDLVNIYFGGPCMTGEVDLQFSGRILGMYSSLAGGDLNLDGFADLICGQNGTQAGGDSGRVAVYFGSAEMDTFPDIEIYQPGRFGETSAWIGDMTGDGWPEFAVSDPAGRGEIYIYTMGDVGAKDRPIAARELVLRVIPNPTRGPAWIRFSGTASYRDAVGIYDLKGRLVRMLGADGSQTSLGVLWDGRDPQGLAVPPGVYMTRPQGEQSRVATPIVVIR